MYSNFRKECKTFKSTNTIGDMNQLNFEPFIHQINQLTNQGFSQGKVFLRSFCSARGKALKFDIMARKAAIETCIWSFLKILKTTENLFYDEMIAFWQ